MRRLFFLLPLLIFMGLVGIFFVKMRQGGGATALPSPLIGHQVPDFSLSSPDAEKREVLSKGDLVRGEVTMVHFFASWCPSCEEELAFLRTLVVPHGPLEKMSVKLYGIAYKDKEADLHAFLESGNPYTKLGLDIEGRVGIKWGVYGVPETYLVAGDGTIRYKWVGDLTHRIFREKFIPEIDRLRAESR